MAVPLPSTTGATIVSEYAAANINIVRTMVMDANGHFEPAFTGQIGYQRTDYVTDGSGNKTAIVQHQPTQPLPGQPYLADPYFGNGQVNAAQLATMDSATPTTGLLTAIAAEADALIQADLVARGIMTATA